MKLKLTPFLIGMLLGVAVTAFVLWKKGSSTNDELQAKKLRLEIDQLRLREAKKDKHVQYLIEQYKMTKDSLDTERKTVKLKYIRYKEPVKLDLSTDEKRDSVINQLIK